MVRLLDNKLVLGVQLRVRLEVGLGHKPLARVRARGDAVVLPRGEARTGTCRSAHQVEVDAGMAQRTAWDE